MVLGKELRFFTVVHRQRKKTVCNIQTQESVGAIPIHTTIKMNVAMTFCVTWILICLFENLILCAFCCVVLCVRVSVLCVLAHICHRTFEGQRAMFRSWFSPTPVCSRNGTQVFRIEQQVLYQRRLLIASPPSALFYSVSSQMLPTQASCQPYSLSSSGPSPSL